MTTARLMKMVLLVQLSGIFGIKHRVKLTIDNNGDHQIRVHTNIRNDEENLSIFFCNRERIEDYSDNEAFNYDPDFRQAEAFIITCIEELDGGADV